MHEYVILWQRRHTVAVASPGKTFVPNRLAL
jgi:hypothetical protein